MATDLTRIGDRARTAPMPVVPTPYDHHRRWPRASLLRQPPTRRAGESPCRRAEVAEGLPEEPDVWESRLSGSERGRSTTGVWTRYWDTAAKAGGKRRTQTSSCSTGSLLPTRGDGLMAGAEHGGHRELSAGVERRALAALRDQRGGRLGEGGSSARVARRGGAKGGACALQVQRPVGRAGRRAFFEQDPYSRGEHPRPRVTEARSTGERRGQGRAVPLTQNKGVFATRSRFKELFLRETTCVTR